MSNPTENSLYHCRNAKDKRLYDSGILGVASGTDVLMANIDRIVDSFDIHFFKQDLAFVLKNPQIGQKGYDMAYLPDNYFVNKDTTPIKETVQVTVRGSHSLAEMEEKARRGLAYKILRRHCSHGANLEIEIHDDYVTMRCIPVILDHSM